VTIRYMTGESRAEEDRRNCPRCDSYRGYVCAEHREPSYEQLQQRLSEVEAHESALGADVVRLLREVAEIRQRLVEPTLAHHTTLRELDDAKQQVADLKFERRFCPSVERWAEVQSELAAYKERAVVQDDELAKVTRERDAIQQLLAATKHDTDDLVAVVARLQRDDIAREERLVVAKALLREAVNAFESDLNVEGLYMALLDGTWFERAKEVAGD